MRWFAQREGTRKRANARDGRPASPGSDGQTSRPEIGRSGSISIIVEARCRRRAVSRLAISGVGRHDASTTTAATRAGEFPHLGGIMSRPAGPRSCPGLRRPPWNSIIIWRRQRRDKTDDAPRRSCRRVLSTTSVRRPPAEAAVAVWKSFAARGRNLQPVASAASAAAEQSPNWLDRS